MTVLSDLRIAQAAQGGGFPLDEIATSVAVALAESGGNPLEVSTNGPSSSAPGSRDEGLFQINDYYHSDLLSKYDWRNPDQNARMAYLIWLERKKRPTDGRPGNGWTAWSTYDDGEYIRFLARGRVAAAELSDRPVFARYLSLKHPLMHGADVAALQRLIGTTPDGDFGRLTDGALRLAQRVLRLAVDGILGPITAKALGGRWIGK